MADPLIISSKDGDLTGRTGLHSDEPFSVDMDWSKRHRSVYWSVAASHRSTAQHSTAQHSAALQIGARLVR